MTFRSATMTPLGGWALALVLLTALLAPPMPQARAADPALASLAGSEWGLPENGKVYIQFRNGRAAGFAGCNRFSGRYAFEAGQLTIGPLAVTRKACRAPVMDGERRFLALLAATRRAAATHLALSLMDANGTTLATLQRRDWD